MHAGLVHSDAALTAAVIRSMGDESLKFLRWEYHTHTDASDGCALHCRSYALSCPEHPCFAMQCTHSHTLSCSQCNLPLHFVHICTQLCEVALSGATAGSAADTVLVGNIEGASTGFGAHCAPDAAGVDDSSEPGLDESGARRGGRRGRPLGRRGGIGRKAGRTTNDSGVNDVLERECGVGGTRSNPNGRRAGAGQAGGPATNIASLDDTVGYAVGDRSRQTPARDGPSSGPIPTLARTGLSLLANFKAIMLGYMAHRLRAQQQDSVRELRLTSMGPRTVFILADFMQKWLTEYFREAQSERFGKTGESVHAC